MGFVTLGTFVFTEQGVQGAILQMINHGLITGGLFLLVGVIYERTHDRTIAKMGGLAARMPVWAAIFGFFVFASAGLPGLSGFVGEFLSLVGTFVVNPYAAAVAAFAMILAAAYLLWMYQRVVFGEVSDFLERLGGHLTDIDPIEILTLVPLATLIVVFGVQPGLLLTLVQGSVDDVLESAHGGQAIPIGIEVVLIGLALIVLLIVARTVSAALASRREDTVAAVEGGARSGLRQPRRHRAIDRGGPDGRGRPHRRPRMAGSRWAGHRHRPDRAGHHGLRDDPGRGGDGDRVQRLVQGRRAHHVPRRPVHHDRRDDDRLRSRLPAATRAARSPSSRSVLIFAMTGAMLIAGSADLLLLFLGLELMVLPGYLLAGYHKTDAYSTEGAIKYFLLGSFSSAIFLFGLAFVWGLDRHDPHRPATTASRPQLAGRSWPDRRRSRPGWRWASRS